jgi:phage gp29-like protein
LWRGRRATTTITRSRVADFTPILWAGRRMTPDQVRMVVEGAIGGNIQEQWALFDMMEDTWPRLAKNLCEVKRAAARVTYAVQPYAERGEKPTDTARERADLVEASLRNWRPKPGTLELSFEDALFNGLDCLGKGLAVEEITWQRAEEGLLPRCAHLLHPSKYGWNAEGTELGLVAAGGRESQISNFRSEMGGSAAWAAFPPGQFWVGVWHSRSGPPGQTALLRCLAPYWCGITFGWEWLLANAQIFGVPFRWATYDPNRPENLGTLSQMLANLGSAGWAAFPEGTTLDFKEAVTRAADNPQVFIQQLADKYADQLILGQEASSESKPAGIGNGASELHGSVRSDRLQDAAQWCADLLNYQLVPAVLRWNWGDEDEPPTIVPELAGEPDPKAKAERLQILAQFLPLPKKWTYEHNGIPEPEEGEETVGGPGSAAGAFQISDFRSQIAGPMGRRLESAAPGRPSDAGAPETAAHGPSAREGSQDTAAAAKRAKLHSPRFAVASSAEPDTAASDQPSAIGDQPFSPSDLQPSRASPALPGDYRPPAATTHALAEARAADFAPLRRAAEPLLAAIEAGNLDVVGELEAFIAKLDALAPQMIGASALADTLEAALAQAAIAGAAGAYRKAEG